MKSGARLHLFNSGFDREIAASMMPEVMATVLQRQLSSQDFRHLGDQERKAIVESVALTVVPSERSADSDRHAVRQVLLALPWAWEPVSDDLYSPFSHLRSQLARLESITVLQPFARWLAREIDQNHLREHVLRLMIGLAYADGGRGRDVTALEPVRLAFNIAGGRAGDIAADLKDEFIALIT